jgi:hypothetical protein
MSEDLMPWRNSRDLFTQTCRTEDLPEKLRLLLERYGSAFDDKYWYFLSSRGKYKGLFARRVPVWQTSKRMPTGKYRPYPVHRGQKRLIQEAT